MAVPSVWMPYCGVAPEPGALLSRWNGDPVLLALVVLGGAFVLGRRRLGARERAPAIAALTLALLLFVSPFCALTSALFAARSAHHVLLTALMAPLLAAAMPRSQLGGVPGALVAWTAASAATLWLWHAPPLYAAALSSDFVYWMMQASLAGTAFGFWLAVRRAPAPAAVGALLAYMVQMGILGALLTFSTAAVYAPHALTTAAWGLSPLQDQQLAGLIMWVPGAAVYLLAALALTRRLFADPPRPAAA